MQVSFFFANSFTAKWHLLVTPFFSSAFFYPLVAPTHTHTHVYRKGMSGAQPAEAFTELFEEIANEK